MRGAPAPEKAQTLAEQHRKVDPDRMYRAALRTQDAKYIRREDGKDEFYSLASDPAETNNVLSTDKWEANTLLARLRALLDENLSLSERLLGTHPASREQAALDKQTRQRLESLGYVE